MYQRAGTSIAECLLHAQQWLDHSAHSIEKDQFWKVIELITEEVVSQACNTKAKTSQLVFCLSTLLNILVDVRHVTIRRLVLLKIKYILHSALETNVSKNIKDEVENILNQFCTAMVKVHEDCQDSFVHFCMSSWRMEIIRNWLGDGGGEVKEAKSYIKEWLKEKTTDGDIRAANGLLGQVFTSEIAARSALREKLVTLAGEARKGVMQKMGYDEEKYGIERGDDIIVEHTTPGGWDDNGVIMRTEDNSIFCYYLFSQSIETFNSDDWANAKVEYKMIHWKRKNKWITEPKRFLMKTIDKKEMAYLPLFHPID